ncbi:CaiB/BaiF CoA transferase family protein [Vibrio sp. WXL210]|uniref:CaiB/BaiF CoA transferase family protein n=1 Tax=Vibrio sp. WXL210 TaxID=3450709 RepID=UPI003EC6A8AF
MKKPLEGITVLEFSQSMSGPYAGLRLADLGARVIKIEQPKYGDACRQLATKGMWANGDSALFHTVNRNKSSFAADLNNPDDIELIRKLIGKVDVITHNFRPGKMQCLGLDFDTIKQLNPTLVYAQVSGYGEEGPWRTKPDQDLLAQAMSGLTWLSGDQEQLPIPFGAAVADILCGTHLVQGVLAALVRRRRTGEGAKVDVSLMESVVDFQFEGLTAYLNNADFAPVRSKESNAHAYLGAPYGIYQTKDGNIALAMGDLSQLNTVLNSVELEPYCQGERYFTERDEAKAIIAKVLKAQSSSYWLTRLQDIGFWCSDVYDYPRLMASEAYQALDMELVLARNEQTQIRTTRCPIRINGQVIKSDKPAPRLGQDNLSIIEEFGL